MRTFNPFRRAIPKASVLDRIYRELARPKKLLFVEDNDMLGEFFRDVVPRHFSVDVVWAESLAKARLKLTAEEFDAALLDVVLPDGSAVDLYREITERWPNMNVAFLTAYDSFTTRCQIQEIGFARVFIKEKIADMGFLGRVLSLWDIAPIPAPQSAS